MHAGFIPGWNPHEETRSYFWCLNKTVDVSLQAIYAWGRMLNHSLSCLSVKIQAREKRCCVVLCVCVCVCMCVYVCVTTLSPHCFLNMERKSMLMSVLREHRYMHGIHAIAEFVHKCLSTLCITQRTIGGQHSVPRFDLVKNEMGGLMNEI